MATPEDIESRLSAVEREVAQLREHTTLAGVDASAARTLSAGADRDVSEVRAELRAHTSVLHALRETQLEHGGRLDRHDGRFDRIDGRLDRLEARVATGFAAIDARFGAIDDRFAVMDDRFAAIDDRLAAVDSALATVNTGVAQIVTMLERLVDRDE